MSFRDEMKSISKSASDVRKTEKKKGLPGDYSYHMSDLVVNQCVEFVENIYKTKIENLNYGKISINNGLYLREGYAYCVNMKLRIELARSSETEYELSSYSNPEAIITLRFRNPEDIVPILKQLMKRIVKGMKLNYIHITPTYPRSANSIPFDVLPKKAFKSIEERWKQQIDSGRTNDVISVDYDLGTRINCTSQGVVK